MYHSSVKIRVRYAETDKMGYCYYGNYAQYYEVARVESLRSLGVSYKELEDSGILLPVMDFQIKYLKPAYYDDEIIVTCKIMDLPKFKISFIYESFNHKKEKINFGSTTLVFFDKKRKKPVYCPNTLNEKLKLYFL